MSCCCCPSQLSWKKDSSLVMLVEWIADFSPHQNYIIWLYLNIAILLWSLLFLAELWFSDDPSLTRSRIEGTEAYLVYSFGSMLVWVLGAGLHLLDHIYEHHIVAGWNHPQDSHHGQIEQYCTPEEKGLLKSCMGNKKKSYESIDPEEDDDDEPNQEMMKTQETNDEEEEERETMRFDLYAILFEFILSIYFFDYSRRAFRKWNTPDDNVADELIDTLINIGAFAYQVVRIWKIREDHIAHELAEVHEKKVGYCDNESSDITVMSEDVV